MDKKKCNGIGFDQFKKIEYFFQNKTNNFFKQAKGKSNLRFNS
jgi:hypothetical protein